MCPKEPPRTGGTVCTDKSGPERTTKIRGYDVLRITVRRQEPPRPGTTIIEGLRVGQKERPKTQEYDLLRIRIGQKKSPKPGLAICYG